MTPHNTLVETAGLYPMSSQNFVFVTWVGTVLEVSDSGKLCHGEFSRRKPPTLIFDTKGELRSTLQSRQAITAVQRRSPEEFGITVDGEYLCAEPGGAIERRQWCDKWETFRLVPVEAAQESAERAAEARLPILPRKPRHTTIAKTIHQTYKTKDIPANCANAVENLRALNPGWDYRYWSDKDVHDFIYQYFGWDILSAYLKIDPRYGATRADLFRYLCIYQMGGVYLDIKSGLRSSLDCLIQPDDTYLLSQWQNAPGQRFARWGLHEELKGIPGGEYQQWHIVGAAGHPFLESVITRVIRNIFDYDHTLDGVGTMGAWRLTGPIAYSMAIHPLRERHPHRIFDAQEAGFEYFFGARADNGANYARQANPIVV